MRITNSGILAATVASIQVVENIEKYKKIVMPVMSVVIPTFLAIIEGIYVCQTRYTYALEPYSAPVSKLVPASALSPKMSALFNQLAKNNQCGRPQAAYAAGGLSLSQSELQTLTDFNRKDFAEALYMSAEELEQWQDVQKFRQEATKAAANLGLEFLNKIELIFEGQSLSYPELVESLSKTEDITLGADEVLINGVSYLDQLKSKREKLDELNKNGKFFKYSKEVNKILQETVSIESMAKQTADIQVKAMDVARSVCLSRGNIEEMTQRFIPNWATMAFKYQTVGSNMSDTKPIFGVEKSLCAAFSKEYGYHAERMIQALGKDLK